MTPDAVFEEFQKGFSSRKFSAGLLIAFIDLLIELGSPNLALDNFASFLEKFPRKTTTSAGKRANTLIVERGDGKTVSLRGFYNKAEDFYRAEHKRFDYPSAAPHATQAWNDYINWLDSLVTYSEPQLRELRGRVNQFVLDTLQSQEFDPSSVSVDPPLFKLLLESFEMTAQAGEPTGASFQGIVFGFLRADNPHLQIEIDKVRTGSKRLQRIGDVDGWDGARLAISAEVKQYELGANAVVALSDFANRTGSRGSLGVVAALGFAENVAGSLRALGVIPLDVEGMLRIVELWDPVKQRIAIASLIYYAKHVEKNSSLTARIEAFVESAHSSWIGTVDAAVGQDDQPLSR